MQQGDKVRIISIPSDLRDDEQLLTRSLFEKCLGKVFVVAEVERVDGVPFALLRLDVGEIVGKPPFMETIWIEPQYVEPVF